MVAETTTSALHLYLQVLRRDVSLVDEIPKFYDIKSPYEPYLPDTKNLNFSDLDDEDPQKIGSVPKNLLKVLSYSHLTLFNLSELEYCKVRRHYENRKRCSKRDLQDIVLTSCGALGIASSTALSTQNYSVEGLFLGICSTAALILGSFNLFGLVNLRKNDELQEFAKLNKIALQTDKCLGKINPQYLHPDLLRDDYTEFF